MGHSKYLKQMHLMAESTKLVLNYNKVALVDSLQKMIVTTESILNG